MQNCEHDFAEQCWVVLAFSNLTCQMLVLWAVSVATVESFIPLFPYKLFKESLQVENVVTFSQHQCKITWRKLCFQVLHQWLSIITIVILGIMFYLLVLLPFTLKGYLVKGSRRIHDTWNWLLHPKLTEDLLRMMPLHYPKEDQWHLGPPNMLPDSAIHR